MSYVERTGEMSGLLVGAEAITFLGKKSMDSF